MNVTKIILTTRQIFHLKCIKFNVGGKGREGRGKDDFWSLGGIDAPVVRLQLRSQKRGA